MEAQTHFRSVCKELTDEEFRAIWRSIHLKVTDVCTVPPEVLWVNGSTIGTLGNFSASTGKAKSKKTFNVSALVAAALSNRKVLDYNATFPENKRKVLYIDTEQSKYHGQKVMRRIYRLAGLPYDSECPFFLFVAMRELSPECRCATIEYMLRRIQGIGLVVIDGIRDLMYDINNPTESTETINMLMRWSATYDIHIHTVLHLNKGDDNTRGHIGTEMNNKAETVLQISKSPFDANVCEVKAMYIRDKEFEPFAFLINEESLPELVPSYECNRQKPERMALTDLSEETHAQVLTKVFSQGNIQGYDALLKALKQGYADIGYDRGRNTLVNLNKWLMSHNLIVKHDKTYSLAQGIYKENEHKPDPQHLFGDEP